MERRELRVQEKRKIRDDCEYMLWRDGIAESVPEAAAKDKVERIKDKADDPDSYFILSPLSFIL